MLHYEKMAHLIAESVGQLFKKDSYLFANSVHETCINHRLAIYLEELVPKYFDDNCNQLSVDLEYNRRMLEDNSPRKMEISSGTSLFMGGNTIEPKRLRPDIVIHQRDNCDRDLLWLEVKIGSDPYICEKDVSKIYHACLQLNFKLVASILIDYPENLLWIWCLSYAEPIEEYVFGYTDGDISCCKATLETKLVPHSLLIRIDKEGKYSCQ